MSGPVSARISGDRLHLQHGPIDLIIGADGDREAAFAAAEMRFSTVLAELVPELPLLRSAVTATTGPSSGTIGNRMIAAVRPFARDGFITPMAAVAGSVADEILSAIEAEATPG